MSESLKPKHLEHFSDEELLKYINYIVTSRGSTYKFLDNGHTQRFKTAENKLCEPQDLIVFIPDYDTLKAVCPENMKANFQSIYGENDIQMEQILLNLFHSDGIKFWCADQDARRVRTNAELRSSNKRAYLHIIENNNNIIIPVSKIPKIGYRTFDTRKYKLNGEEMREKHIGNKIIQIVYK